MTSKSKGYLSAQFSSTKEAMDHFEKLKNSGEEVINVFGLPIEDSKPTKRSSKLKTATTGDKSVEGLTADDRKMNRQMRRKENIYKNLWQ